MNDNRYNLQVRWSDVDANFHVRHSVYYDWGAFCRLQFFAGYGLTMQMMQQLSVGFILFREECVFRKEVLLNDDISINIKLLKAKKDFSRLTIQHHIIKADQKSSAAILTVDGAWINVNERKLTAPPEQVLAVFNSLTTDEDFEWI